MQLPNQTMVPFLAGLLLAGTSAFVAEEMRKRGIEDLIPSHGNLLVHLFGGEALTVTELAQRTGRTKSTISVLAGKLEKAGYLRREPDPADARLLRLRLTKKGEALEDAFAEITAEMHRKISEGLGEQELACSYAIRRTFAKENATELLFELMKKTKNNEELAATAGEWSKTYKAQR